MRPAATAAGTDRKMPAASTPNAPIRECAELYDAAPTLGPARYPRNDRSGAKKNNAKTMRQLLKWADKVFL